MSTDDVGARLGAATPAGMASAWLIALLAVACLAFWPGSGYGPSTLTDWQDQATFLRAATQSLELGLPDAETRTLVGPAYVGLILTLGKVTGLDPAGALSLLSRLTFVACAAVLATVAMRFRAQARPGFQLALAAIAVFSLGTSVWFRFFDIPWTHFVAAAILGAIVLVSLARLPLAVRAALVGVLAIALVQTRLFEAMVMAIAALLLLPVALVRHWPALRREPQAVLLKLALPAIGGGVLGFVAIGAMSGNWALYQQYSDQSGMVLALGLAPLKAVQLFWDTCFATVCEFATAPVGPALPNSLESWRQPVTLQLPGLAAAAAGLLLLFVLRPARARQLPLGVLFAIVAAGGIVLAYVAGAPSGSPHLKYGFFRDFVPALVLLTAAFIAVLAVQRAEDGRIRLVLAVPVIVYFAVLFGLSGLRTVGLPPLGAEVQRFEIASTCSAGQCRFELTTIGTDGTAIGYDDLAYVTCTSDPQLKPLWRVSELTLDAAQCGKAAIVPVASGLLYAPEDDGIFERPLDLGLASDRITIPDDIRR